MTEDIRKRVEDMMDEYEYWYEVFRRETDPVKREEAKSKYMPLRNEAFRLVSENHIYPVPGRSYKQRALMDYDHERKRLRISDRQLHEEGIEARFGEEKKRARAEFYSLGADERDEAIEAIQSELEAAGLDISELGSMLWLVEDFYSGEIFVADHYKREAGALKAFDSEKYELAEEMFRELIMRYDTASKVSKLPSGPDYFGLEKERRKAHWEQAKWGRRRLDQTEKIKGLIVEIVRQNPGIRQSDLHKFMPGIARNEIWEPAYRLYEAEIIRREKCGNTSRLYLV